MPNSKPSLIDKVQHIEEEAAAIITQSHERVAHELADMKERTQASKIFLQEQAAQTSESILTEHTAHAKKEAQQILSQSQSVAEQVHTSAKKNMARALEKARLLFNEEFGTNL